MRSNSTTYRYRIKFVLYMYDLGTAPNVQNWAGFAVCTPYRYGRFFHSEYMYSCILVVHVTSLTYMYST